MLLAVKIRVGLFLCLLVPCVALGQAPSRVQVGVCVDADRFEAVQAAGFDYIETNASKVAALTDDEFQRLAEQVAQLRIPVAASMSFIPAAIKLTGPRSILPARWRMSPPRSAA